MDVQEMICEEDVCIRNFFSDQYYDQIINDLIFIDALNFFKKTKCHSKIIEFIINHENCTKSIPKDIIAKIICKKIAIVKYMDIVLGSGEFFDIFDIPGFDQFKLLQIRNNKNLISAIHTYTKDNDIAELLNM